MKKLLMLFIFLFVCATTQAAFEDFSAYSNEQDGGGKIDAGVTLATKASWANITRDEETYLADDKGAAFFSGDFHHQFIMQVDNTVDNGFCPSWGLGNSLQDLKAVMDASEDAVSIDLGSAANITFRLIEDGALESFDTWAGASEGVPYYIDVVRDDDGGVNNTGRYTVEIRITSHAGALQDTLGGGTGNLDCSAGEQNDFRYQYCVWSFDDNNSNDCDGYTENLDLSVGAGGFHSKMINHGKVGGKLSKRGGK